MARRCSAVFHPQRNQQALPFAQGHLCDERGVHLIVLVRDAQGERGDAIGADDREPNVLLPTRDDRAPVPRDKRDSTWRGGIIGADFEGQRDLHFTTGAFDCPDETMEGVILTHPGIGMYILIQPGAQCLHGHEIRQHHLASDTGEFRLQHVTTA